MAAGISRAPPGRGKPDFNIVNQVKNFPRPGGAYGYIRELKQKHLEFTSIINVFAKCKVISVSYLSIQLFEYHILKLNLTEYLDTK